LKELSSALEAEAVLAGSVERQGGEVVLDAVLAQPMHGGSTPLSGTGSDLFKAGEALAGKVMEVLPGGPAPGSGRPEWATDEVLAAWDALVQDPWTEEHYDRFLDAARRGGGEDAVRLAEALRKGSGKEGGCGLSGGSGADGGSARMSLMAPAVCLFRRSDYEGALLAAQAAFEEVGCRPWAARFIAKVDGQVRTIEERIRFLEQLVALFPDDYEAWWLLALLHSTAGSASGEAAPVLQVAGFLSAGKEVSFPVALNAVRALMQLGDYSAADEWLGRLQRAKPRSDWDLMWRDCRHAGLLQLRGRFKEAQDVLERSRGELAAAAGDPFTIVATALFYSYLHFGMFAEAERVAAEFASMFKGKESPDEWSAELLALALKAAGGQIGSTELAAAARSLGDELGKAVGEGGKRERDALVCLLLSHVASPAAAREWLLQADPANRMLGACRYSSGIWLAGQGRAAEAAEELARARADIVYRSDWSYELHLPAMAAQAAALERAGRTKEAAELFQQLVRQYRNADRELPALDEARAAAGRLGYTP
jgi:tetratricopeptide (TPR) repeat protein